MNWLSTSRPKSSILHELRHELYVFRAFRNKATETHEARQINDRQEQQWEARIAWVSNQPHESLMVITEIIEAPSIPWEDQDEVMRASTN